MFLELSKNATLLQLHIKLLQRTIDGLIWLNNNVDQRKLLKTNEDTIKESLQLAVSSEDEPL